MADMPDFGTMDIDDRAGSHEFNYGDERNVPPTHGLTPSQTVGPFFAYGLTPGSYGYPFKDIHSTHLNPVENLQNSITIEGQVIDGDGMPVHDALVEFIQADGSGNYADHARNDGFTGFGRCGTGSNGPSAEGGDTHFRFDTLKPGATQDESVPFICVIVTMRGLLNHCITRIYFPEDDHASDLVMQQVPEDRRHTLIAQDIGPGRYRFDIHMQGDDETVFFDI